jgi:hypothetical protein
VWLAFLAAPATVTADPIPLGAEFTAGAMGFLADDTMWEGLVGGNLRLYVRPSTSIGPEISYVKGEGHSHLLLTAVVNHELGGRTSGQSRQTVPFVKIGAGVIGSPGSIFTSHAFVVTGGGGLRIRTAGRVTVGAEAGIGWVCCGEFDIRATGSVGVQLGR